MSSSSPGREERDRERKRRCAALREERRVRRQERRDETPRDREERIANMTFSGQRVSKGKRRKRRDDE